MERRKFLAAVGLVFPCTLAGCFADRTFDPSDHLDDWQDERARGEADPIEDEQPIESDGIIEVRCGRVARDTLREVVSDRLDQPSGLSFGFGTDPQREENESDTADEYRLVVRRTIHRTRDGDVRSKPDVGFETLREVTPREVRMTVKHGDAEHTCRYPVYIEDSVLREG